MIYLDFDGYQNQSYLAADRRTYNINVPPSDLDPSAREDIRRRVEEDFAPFDVEVVIGAEPPQLSQGFASGVRVAIGGSSQGWGYPRTVCGVSPDPTGDNAALVAQRDCAGSPDRSPKAIARSASHELGHTFGLLAGQPLSHYTLPAHHALPGQTPILGGYFPDRRDVWYTHPNPGQNDFYALWQALGLRAPDHVGWPGLGETPLTTDPSTGDLQGAGIVEMSWGFVLSIWEPDPSFVRHMPLRDYFAFNAGWGTGGDQLITIRVDTINTGPADHAANLDADLVVFFDDPGASPRFQPVTLTRGDQSADLFAEASFRISASDYRPGVYLVGVQAEGGYGDLGQYTVTVEGEDVSPAIRSRVVPPDTSDPEHLEWFYTLLRDVRTVPDKAGVQGLLAVFARHGAFDETFAGSKATVLGTEAALRKHPPLEVFGGLFDWDAWNIFSKRDRKRAREVLRAALQRFALDSSKD